MRTKFSIEMEIWRWIVLFITSFIGIWVTLYALFGVFL